MDQERSGKVVALGEESVPRVADVLCESFFDYPVMRFVLGADAADYERRLGTLVRFFVTARVLRRETILGVGDGAHLEGAALVSRPATESPPALRHLREQVWEDLGESFRARYESFAQACSRFPARVPHLYLNMVGVRRACQGKGVGRRLIEHVHLLSRAAPDSRGVALTTEDPANLPLYERLGYRLLGRASVALDLETWCFFRPDGASPGQIPPLGGRQP